MARSVSPEVARLRALAVQRHKAATRKISRNKVSRGAEISGSSFDPRRDLANVRKYNSKQLSVYIAQLDDFTSRKSQFVPDAKYRPIPAHKWKSYQEAEKALNAINKAEFKRFEKKILPDGMTVKQKMAQVQPIHPHMHNPASNSVQNALNRKSKTVKSLQALDKLEMDLRKRATPKHQKELEKADRISVDKMLRMMGDEELANRVSKLSSNKFKFMFSYSGKFATNLSMDYEAWKKMMEAQTEERMGQFYHRRDLAVLESRRGEESARFVSWLEQQDETQDTTPSTQTYGLSQDAKNYAGFKNSSPYYGGGL